MPVEAASE